MPNRLVVDMTELAGWQGKLTGVPRVMSELCRRFADNKSEVIFTAWDGANKCLVQLAYSPETVATDTPKQEAAYVTSSWLVQAKGAYRRIKNSSALVNKTLSGPERVVRKVALRPNQTSGVQAQAVQLQQGDTLLVLADWHGSDSNYIEYLVALHGTGVVLVQMVYDLLPLVAPQYSGHATEYLTRYVRAVYPLCSRLIAISEHTKADVAKWLQAANLRVPPISVVRLGDDFHVVKPAQPVSEHFTASGLSGDDYILCVGTIEARKNHTLLYYAYKLAESRGVQLPKLVIVGRQGWQAENIYEIMTHDPVTKDNFVILENINDNELSWLYEHCLFSIYPSFYEGWGLPIAESVAHGVPCLSSNTSSMPEIAGNLLMYFSPYSPEECLAAITTLLDRPTLKSMQRKMAKYRPATWQQTFEALQSIIGGINEPE